MYASSRVRSWLSKGNRRKQERYTKGHTKGTQIDSGRAALLTGGCGAFAAFAVPLLRAFPSCFSLALSGFAIRVSLMIWGGEKNRSRFRVKKGSLSRAGDSYE